MPKRRRKPVAERRAGRFLPDRIVGFLSALGPLVTLSMALALAALGGVSLGMNPANGRSRDPASIALFVGVILAFFALSGFLVWVSVRVAQSRKVGFVITAVLSGIGVFAILYSGNAAGRPGLVSLWQFFVLIYCFARLGGWGPKPT